MERSIQVLDRAIAVLHACEAGPATLQDLVVRTGLPRATTHRLASALEGHGLLCRDDGRWALGPALARMGSLAGSGPPLAEAARPALAALRDATGESVQLYVRRGDRRLCLVALDSPHSLRTIVSVGAVLPLDRGSAGRVLRGDPTGDAGWIESVEEREQGVASVSAPVLDRRGPLVSLTAAVSVSGPLERTTRAPGKRYGAVVAEAARAVERAAALCPDPSPRG